MRFFMVDIGGQHCKVCHRELRVADGPHSLPTSPGRPVDFVCPEHCPVCASNAKQLQMEEQAS